MIQSAQSAQSGPSPRSRGPVLAALLTALLAAACRDRPQPIAPDWFAGRVLLQGSLAQETGGVVFVIVRQKGQNMPSLTERFPLGAAVRLPDGTLQLPFELDRRDDMGGLGAPLDGELELEARFDRDGIVETRDDTVRSVVPVRRGDRNLELVLDPGS